MKRVNISKTVRDRLISSEFLTHRVIQECPIQRKKIQFSPLLAAILDFGGKGKSVNISKTLRDRAILSEFLTHRIIQEYPIRRGKISIFAAFSVYLGYLPKKCEYVENHKR